MGLSRILFLESYHVLIKFCIALTLTGLCLRSSNHSSDIYPHHPARVAKLTKLLCSGQGSSGDNSIGLTREDASNDFGNISNYAPPLEVLFPSSVSGISCIVKSISETRSVTVTARGRGHSLNGQALAPGGVVIAMSSLRDSPMVVSRGGEEKGFYVDVSGGRLWIDVLRETLMYGVAPRSWTDYLYLSVGGTLSNAGIGGQTFRYGPQIDNVYQLEVLTGKGELLNCSANEKSDLFYGVLGGLGQFGIITQARIRLQEAPKMVAWIRASYSDLLTFCHDQEHLISLSSEHSFDYIEGFVKIHTSQIDSSVSSTPGTLYILEVVKHLNLEDRNSTDKVIKSLLSSLNYLPSTLEISEVTYIEFLDRVHISEMKLQARGLWKVPHPWLNLLIPRTKIIEFGKGVFGSIVQDSSTGPILMYPVNRSMWNQRTSAVIPEGDVFYQVAFLFSAVPSFSTGEDVVGHFLSQNGRILDFCQNAELGVKQYLPHYTTRQQWVSHFGPRWGDFQRRKSVYDPLEILAPGQQIFT